MELSTKIDSISPASELDSQGSTSSSVLGEKMARMRVCSAHYTKELTAVEAEAAAAVKAHKESLAKPPAEEVDAEGGADADDDDDDDDDGGARAMAS